MINSTIKEFLSLDNLERLLLFAVVVFLPTQLGKHFWNETAFVFSLPVDYLVPRIYFWDILVVGLIGVWVIKRQRVNDLAFFCLLLFLLSQIISLFWAESSVVGLVRFEQMMVSGMFGVYLASKGFIRVRSLIGWGLVIAVIYESGLAILQFITNRSVGLWFLGEREFAVSDIEIAKFNFFGQVFLRPYATLPHPNLLAGFLVLSVPLLYLCKFSFRFFVAGLLVITTFLTFSRTALLVLFLELVVIFKSKIRRLLVIGVILLPVLYVRFSSAFNFDYLSIVRREELSEVALTLFNENRLFGVGLNNFIVESSTSQLISGQDRFLQPVHNFWLLILSESGLLGLTGSLVLIGIPLFLLFRSRDLVESRVLLCCWGVILFLGLFDHYFLSLAQGQRLFFLVWGLSFSTLNKDLGRLKYTSRI